MQISYFLKNKNFIYFNKEFKDKNQALKFFSNQLLTQGYAHEEKKVFDLFVQRENELSTGIGDSIALPHIRSDVMKKSTLMFAKVKDLNWDSLDGKNVKYIFVIAMSKDEGQNSHLEVIAQLSKLLLNKDFINNLNSINEAEKFISLVDKFENQLLQDEAKNDVIQKSNEDYEIVAVASCPTGIAHTYLAAQRLVETAKDMKVKIKVETQGAQGSKNVLSSRDIEKAKGVILAIDREIEKQRFFNSENVIETSTREAIHNPKNLIEKSRNLQGKKIKASQPISQEDTQGGYTFDNFFKRMYRSLMSGISYMLPFVVFGGIIISIGFLIDTIYGATSGISSDPKFLANFGSNHIVAKWFNRLGGIAFSIMVAILAAYITYSLVGRQGLLPGFVIGFISSGRLKDTYSFLTDSLTNNYGLSPDKVLETGSGFVGAILGGFFAATMLILMSKYIFSKLPKNLYGIRDILFIPILGTLTIAFVFWVLNIVFIYINYGLTILLLIIETRREIIWLLGLILGIMMAVDLGGPINKAAYVFGTLTLAQMQGKGTIAMASVMIAGMTPPLGISVSMFLHKKLWSKQDIEAGKISNILFGLSFISEGAIPYTSRNTKVMIPSNIIGSAVASLLSASLGVSIAAPHGGIFVFFLARSSLFESQGLSIAFGILFLIGSIIIGSFVSAFSIYFLTKFYQKRQAKKESLKTK